MGQKSGRTVDIPTLAYSFGQKCFTKNSLWKRALWLEVWCFSMNAVLYMLHTDCAGLIVLEKCVYNG